MGLGIIRIGPPGVKLGMPLVVRAVAIRNYIGTSGWSYPHWRGGFYPEGLPVKKQFEYYCTHFDTVEINASFYNLLRDTTVEKWMAAAPAGFTFVVKGSRFVTHMKRLADPDETTKRFFESITGFGDALGPILWQLPPRFPKNPERLEQFLASLPGGYRYTFEFRDHSWHDNEVYEILRNHNAAFCIYELAGFTSPIEATADFVYLRLHGPGRRKYQGEYGNDKLAPWARRIRGWNRDRLSVYCYFDNDEHSYATFDALRLKEQLEGQQAAVNAG